MAADRAAAPTSRSPGDAHERPAGPWRRWGAARRGAILVTALGTVLLAAGCTGSGSPDPTVPVTTTPASAGEPSGIRPADLAAIRATIDAINATAGGPVAAQRAELDKLAAPQQVARQRACPAAHSTLAFQPAYQDLRTAGPDDIASTSSSPSAVGGSAGSAPLAGSTPSVTDSAGAPTGTPYLLPAFITIYTGDRITGTDLTTLHLWVINGSARTGALCVS